MNKTVRTELRRELSKRGFSSEGSSQHESIVLDNDYLDGVEIGDLLDLMVQRREKYAHAGDSLSEAAGKRNYDDAVSAVEAIKAVINRRLDD